MSDPIERMYAEAFDMSEGVGELGIGFNEVGGVAQSLGVAAVERGNVDREEVIAYMRGPEYDEDELWTVLGPLIDKIEDGTLAMKGLMLEYGEVVPREVTPE